MTNSVVRSRCTHCRTKVKCKSSLRQFTCPRCHGANVLAPPVITPERSMPVLAAASATQVFRPLVASSPATLASSSPASSHRVPGVVWVFGSGAGLLAAVSLLLLWSKLGMGGISLIPLSGAAVLAVAWAFLQARALQLAHLSTPRHKAARKTR